MGRQTYYLETSASPAQCELLDMQSQLVVFIIDITLLFITFIVNKMSVLPHTLAMSF